MADNSIRGLQKLLQGLKTQQDQAEGYYLQ